MAKQLEPIKPRRRLSYEEIEDLRAQERGPGLLPGPGRTAPGYIRTTSPQGEPVVYVPGELLPQWVDLQAATLDEDTGVWTVGR